MYIYLILEQLMKDKDLSIAKVAHLCGLPDSTVRGIIKRKQKSVALEVAFKLARGLGVPIEYLNDGPQDSPDSNSETTESPPETDEEENLRERVLFHFDHVNLDGKRQIAEQAELVSSAPKYQAGREADTVSA